jgi:hypothetical protein
LGRAIEDRAPQLPALLQVALDVLDGDRRVVHQDAHREGEPAEGHDVIVSPSALSAITELRIESGIDTAMMRCCATPEEQQDHQGGQARRDDRLVDHPHHRAPHEDRLVGEQVHLELGGSVLATRGMARRMLSTISRVETFAHLEHGEQRAAAAVTPQRCSSAR